VLVTADGLLPTVLLVCGSLPTRVFLVAPQPTPIPCPPLVCSTSRLVLVAWVLPRAWFATDKHSHEMWVFYPYEAARLVSLFATVKYPDKVRVQNRSQAARKARLFVRVKRVPPFECCQATLIRTRLYPYSQRGGG
jgi:hypothetical protein